MSGLGSLVGIDNFKPVFHNWCAAARSKILYDVMNPNESSLDGLLRSVWARTLEKTNLSLTDVKDSLSSELNAIHPLVLKHYSERIDTAPSVKEIDRLARSYFAKSSKISKEELQSLVVDIRKDAAISHEYPAYQQVPEKLKSVWEGMQQEIRTFPSVEKAKEAIKSRLEAAILPSTIQEIYLQDLQFAHSLDKISTRLQGYLSDLEIKVNGIIATSVGSQGYPKLIDVPRNQHRISAFIKTLRNREEMAENSLYSLFEDWILQDPEIQRKGITLRVPKSSMFDLEEKCYIDSAGNKHPFPALPEAPDAYAQYLKSLLSYIASASTPREDFTLEKEQKFQKAISTKPVGFFERIEGFNLSDFFTEKYLGLASEMQDRIFFSIGLVAFLDLVVGNRDRLINVFLDHDPDHGTNRDKDQYPSWESLTQNIDPDIEIVGESNLGNLMVSQDLTQIFAIDNGVGDGQNSFVQSEGTPREDLKYYLDFLGRSLQTENLEILASQCLMRALQQAITTSAQGGKNKKLNRTELNGLLTSLEDRTPSLIEGMKHMRGLLSTQIIPKWNSQVTNPRTTGLPQELCDVIQQRFNVFQTLSNNASAENFLDLRSETPASPRMASSKSEQLHQIAIHLENLSQTIGSQDTRRFILEELDSLMLSFEIDENIKTTIEKIQGAFSNGSYSRPLIQELSLQIQELSKQSVTPSPAPRLPLFGRAVSNENGKSLLNNGFEPIPFPTKQTVAHSPLMTLPGKPQLGRQFSSSNVEDDKDSAKGVPVLLDLPVKK